MMLCAIMLQYFHASRANRVATLVIQMGSASAGA